MGSVYTDYFQKSKVFLYPLLRLRKGITYVPIETYICWDTVFEETDNKFMCLYKSEYDDSFKEFEDAFLKNHELLFEHVNLGKEQLYIFDFEMHAHDFEMFVEGKYSKFTLNNKIAILDFFGSQGRISSYVKGFLTPDEELHAKYAERLGVDKELMENIFEVCSVPDIYKETLYCSIPFEIDLFGNDNLLSLNK